MYSDTVSEGLKPFNFKLSTDMKFGLGIYKDIAVLLADYNFGPLCMIVDSALLNNNKVRDLIKSLQQSLDVVTVFENKSVEPDYDYLDSCKAELVSLKFDSLIAIGGGSTIDLAKGIAVLMRNPGRAISFRGWNLAKNPALPVIAFPTTAGTGSEVTPNAVFIAKDEKRKLGINTDYVRPQLAILDPELTLSCPRSVTVSSGMDALTHALESFVAKNATLTSRIFSKEAFSLVFNNLPMLLDDMGNVELRGRLLLGSYYAGIALMNSGAGPAGALSYVLGVHYNVPHGLAGAVFLPQVVKLNVQRDCNSYTPLYDLIEGADLTLDESGKSEKFAELFKQLCQKASVPESLEQFGVSRNNLDFLVEESFWLKAAIEQNPVHFKKEEIRMLWESLLN